MTQEPSEPTSPAAGEAAAAVVRAVEPGARLGRYEVSSALGEGGMATVFLASDPELRREVAIKVLFPHLARRSEVVARFQREARAAARLRHPAILQTFDVGGGDRGEPPYIVMELVRGPTLADHLSKHGPPLAEVVAAVGVCLAEALAVAHDAGVIHRDLKPGNLLVSDDGRLLLADFGVAHVERDESLATRTGAVLGTPAYMSPEQAVGEQVDVRSDLYSLGATLYHLATGAPPYAGSVMKVLGQLATPGALPPADQRRPAVGRELSAILQRLMAHDPAARPADARQVAALLRPLAEQLGEPAQELAAYWRDPDEYLRGKAPVVSQRLVSQARERGARGQWASALGLADRALAIDPQDEVARTLAHELLRRSRGGRGRGWLAVALLAVVAGAGSWAWWRAAGQRGSDAATEAPAPALDRPVSASVDSSAQVASRAAAAEELAPPAPTAPTFTPAAPRPAAPRPTVVRARPSAASSAAPGPAPEGAAPPARASDPAPRPTDAAEPGLAPAPAPAPAPAAGAVTFAMDAWCELTIDGVPHGRADSRRAIALAPGRHEVECSQGAGLGQWSGAVHVVSGQAQRVTGQVRAEVKVAVATSGTAVLVNGTKLANGAELRLHNGRHRISVLAGERELQAGWVSIPRVARCVLRDRPVLDCYPSP